MGEGLGLYSTWRHFRQISPSFSRKIGIPSKGSDDQLLWVTLLEVLRVLLPSEGLNGSDGFYPYNVVTVCPGLRMSLFTR